MGAELLKIWSTLSARVLVGVVVVGGGVLLVLAATASALLGRVVDLDRRYPGLRLTDVDHPRFDEVLALLDVADPGYQRSLVDLVSTGPFGTAGSVGLTTTCALLVGVLVAAGDLRHGGVALTALAVPDRLRIVAHKVGAVAVVLGSAGIVLAVLSAGTLALAVTGTSGAALAVTPLEVAGVWCRGIAVLVLLGVLGVGLGLLVRHLTVAVAAVLVAALVEPVVVVASTLLTGTVPPVVAALPLSASRLASRGTTIDADLGLGVGLAPGVALAALAAWVVVHLAAGAWRTQRGDLA
ncbi:hypothetical protein [Cellulomonas triticagri]|uniref:Uncharacterized protein n=1 Tax=Cellulomonas triticagri TaxID=2483352 RepID=A0A3M2JIK7_9CELL|nr:hypothetical protein [Cellulomonas triticagri]RMI13612.1 hypothetical protein EBM89_03660 [Cellulomonas triticagri]